MTCKMCRERGKTWQGSDPVCAFDGKFEDNWMCATALAVRDLLRCWEEKDLPEGIKRQYADDQTYATILVHEIDGVGEEEEYGFWCLWVTWYKDRGRTGAMWLLGDEDSAPPRRPTEAELLAIIAHYNGDPA